MNGHIAVQFALVCLEKKPFLLPFPCEPVKTFRVA